MPAQQRVSHFTAKPGGVMTDEVGVITGELTLRTEVNSANQVVQLVQYKDATEWYVVTGSRGSVSDPQDIDTIHRQALERWSAS